MNHKENWEVYLDFLEFVSKDLAEEQVLLNRKIRGVFLWCFAIPAVASATILLFSKVGLLPRSARAWVDWVSLLFPISFSLFTLGSEVIVRIPIRFKKGALAPQLAPALQAGQWRSRVSGQMTKLLHLKKEEWDWVVENFKMDLDSMLQRTRFLTALAGAVFFLVMQGIDSVADEPLVLPKHMPPQAVLLAAGEWAMGGISQYVGLSLFLTLLYLSGAQTHQTLLRYLRSAELARLEGIGSKE